MNPNKFDKRKHDAWKAEVLQRDGYACADPGCNRPGSPPHHIIHVGQDASLRYMVWNGISLCGNHHRIAHDGFTIKQPLVEERRVTGRQYVISVLEYWEKKSLFHWEKSLLIIKQKEGV